MAKTISMENRTMRLPQEYVDAVSDGYYEHTNGGWYIKKEFLIDYPAELAEMMADICPGLAGSQLADYDVDLRCWLELLESGTVDAEVVKEELYMWVASSKMRVHRDFFPEALHELIKINVTGLETKEDIIAFIKHFRCLIRYLPN